MNLLKITNIFFFTDVHEKYTIPFRIMKEQKWKKDHKFADKSRIRCLLALSSQKSLHGMLLDILKYWDFETVSRAFGYLS